MNNRKINVMFGHFEDMPHVWSFYNEKKAINAARMLGDSLQSIEYSDGTKLEIVDDYLDGKVFCHHLEPVIKANYYNGDLRRFVKTWRSLGHEVKTYGNNYQFKSDDGLLSVTLKQDTDGLGLCRVLMQEYNDVDKDWHWVFADWPTVHDEIVKYY